MSMSNGNMAMSADASGAGASGAGAPHGMMMSATHPGGELPVEGEIPSFAGATLWLNSAPLTAESLRGKVVMVDFWTYSCINCLRALPFVKSCMPSTRITAGGHRGARAGVCL